jgi:hypothetical protein
MHGDAEESAAVVDVFANRLARIRRHAVAAAEIDLA